jgi:hypothetical protein
MRERNDRSSHRNQTSKLTDGQADGCQFDSASEFACAALLERYTNWRAVQGVTIQVPIGRCKFDFFIGGTLVEFHPISLRREFLTDGLSMILSASRSLSKNEKLKLLDAIVEEFKAQYEKRRGQVAAADGTYRSCELLCVFTHDEFIEQVLTRFATKSLPSTSDLCKEFRQLCRVTRRTGRRG